MHRRLPGKLQPLLLPQELISTTAGVSEEAATLLTVAASPHTPAVVAPQLPAAFAHSPMTPAGVSTFWLGFSAQAPTSSPVFGRSACSAWAQRP